MPNVLSKGKILIVDDSEMNRSILSDILSDEYEIMEAGDGQLDDSSYGKEEL